MQSRLSHHYLLLLHSLFYLPNNFEFSRCWDMVEHFVSVTLHHMLGSVFVLADMYSIPDVSGVYRVGQVLLNSGEYFPLLM